MKKISLFLIIFAFSVSAYGLSEWDIKKSTHFVVYYREAPDHFVDKVIEKAEALYEDITEYLGFRRYDFWLWDERAKIYIFKDAQEYQEKTRMPAWSGASASSKEKVIKTYPWKEGFFESALPHEMTHIILREFLGHDSPDIALWLEEGIASYKEEVKPFDIKRILKSAIIDRKFIHLESLHLFNPSIISDPALISIYYAEAVGIVDFLINEFGKENFARFLRALRDKKTLDEAIELSYPFKNLRELDQSWQLYLTDE